MWFSIKRENEDFFSAKVYDPFVLVPFYIAMHYGENLKIRGKVSKKLYKNLTSYVQRILLDFSDAMKPISFTVEGFDMPEKDGSLIGSGISCGVDSFSTIYDRYVQEKDPEYQINSLFLFNCGTHGDYEDERSHKLFLARYELNKNAAKDLGLPTYAVESNLHAFTHKIGEQKVGFFAIWSCIISMQRKLSKYYVASALSFTEITNSQSHNHDFDMDEYCGSYITPLIRTESLELIYDGAQYRRTEKTQNIADWDIAQKHLNVCVAAKETAENCSCCPKCFRTLIALESLDKLDSFAKVFNLERYQKTRFRNLCNAMVQYHTNNFDADNIIFAKARGVKLPPKLIVCICHCIYCFPAYVKKAVKRVIGDQNAKKLKKYIDQ